MAFIIWVLGSVLPKVNERIVVHSIPDWEDGANAVLAELLQRGYDPVLLMQRNSPPPAAKLEQIRRLSKNSVRGRWNYLTARCVITTHNVYRPHPVMRGQVLVNIWHGEGTKPVGRFDGDTGLPCTWTTSISALGKALRCAEMGVAPAQVLVVGAPRNDRLLTADVEKVRDLASADKPTDSLLLWLPTYRASAFTGRVDGDSSVRPLVFTDTELAELDDWLVEHDSQMLVKLHPQAAERGRLPALRAIRQIDEKWLHHKGLSLYELLLGVDGLVTDVSSVWVDFLLTDKPILFAFPDLDAYRESRGFLFEPYEDWIPGPLATTIPEMLEWLGMLGSAQDPFTEVRRQWRDRAHLHHDAKSTARLLDALGL